MPLIPSDAPDDYQRSVLKNAVPWMASNWSHPEDPSRNYDFYDASKENRLDYLLDEDSHLHADNWTDINVLLFARGTLKTTSTVAIATWLTNIYPTTAVSMMAPRKNQVGRWMERYSDRVDETNLANYYDIDQKHTQKFVRNIDSEVGETRLITRIEGVSAYGEGDAVRGDHAHFGVVDEFQDVGQASFEAYSEAVDRENPNCPFFPCRFVIGTPKLEGSYYSDVVSRGEKLSWNEDEKTWEKISDATIHNEDGSPRVRVWHLDQWNSPLHSDSEVEYKQRTMSEQKFKNEIEATFYSAEDNLLADRHINQVLNQDKSFPNRRQNKDSTVTIGVDWGGGSDETAADTVIAVGEHTEHPNGDITSILLNLYFVAESLTKKEEIQKLEDIMSKYDADRVLVDEGFGTAQREMLQNGTIQEPRGHDDVYGCRFGNVRDNTQLKWNSGDGKRFVTVDKSYQIERTVDAFKDGRLEIPAKTMNFDGRYSQGVKMKSQLTAPYKDLVETTSGKKKVRVKSDRQDDAIDAFTYMLLADRSLSRRNINTDRFSSSRRF